MKKGVEVNRLERETDKKNKDAIFKGEAEKHDQCCQGASRHL